ncbi:hypothetical protein [Amycolatopsis echigonensis]|nr:hypothetical protein [Amycolatopsis niigatensis]
MTEEPKPVGSSLATPRRTGIGDHDPTDQNWQEVGDEIQLAAQRAGRAWQQPETD